jgi:hypothetical protein
MVANILDAIERIKADVAAHLSAEAVERHCRDLKYTWRDRLLGPAMTVHLFLLQVLHRNTACTHMPHLAEMSFTGRAFSEARARLPLELFERLVAGVSEALGSVLEEGTRWCGHRVWFLDGSSCSMADTPVLQTEFGQPGGQKPGCGFPVAHLLMLFHAGTGLLQKLIVAPLRTHDLSGAALVHSGMAAGDVLIADRGLCSFAHLAMVLNAGIHAIFRLHQKQIVSFRKGRMHVPPSPPYPRMKGAKGLPRSRWVKWLGTCDQVVEYFKPKTRPAWMAIEAYAALPDKITVRELRYKVSQRGYRVNEVILVTTLLDVNAYPAAELAQAYCDRWRIEVNFRHLKQTLNMDVLHTKTVAGVKKELQIFAIVYNLVRLVIVDAARQKELAPDQISFVDAVRWLCHFEPGKRLETLALLVVLPHRPGRVEPRVRKRRPKQYPLMKRPRSVLQKALLAKGPKT